MGFDTNEVAEFLAEVAEEMEALIHERNKLKETMREKELQILEYRDRDRILKDTLTTAQKMSEKIKSEAERETNIILQDAHHKAEMIVRDARDSLKSVYKEVNEVKKVKLQFEGNLKAMIQTHLELLAKQEQYLPHIPEISKPSYGERSNERAESAQAQNQTEKLVDRIQKERAGYTTGYGNIEIK